MKTRNVSRYGFLWWLVSSSIELLGLSRQTFLETVEAQ